MGADRGEMSPGQVYWLWLPDSHSVPEFASLTWGGLGHEAKGNMGLIT